jgi:hypothetical protein
LIYTYKAKKLNMVLAIALMALVSLYSPWPRILLHKYTRKQWYIIDY